MLNDTIRKYSDESEYDTFYNTTGLQRKVKAKENIFGTTGKS